MEKRLLKEGDVVYLSAEDFEKGICIADYFEDNDTTYIIDKYFKDDEGWSGSLESRLEGKYVVTKTTFDGGGNAHGPHDVFPDGHHVFCESIEDPEIKIEFYQTGCFNNMIKNPKIISNDNDSINKMSNERVGEYISMEGLEYAIKDGISADEFEDPKLAEMWKKAEKQLRMIENYLEEYIEYM